MRWGEMPRYFLHLRDDFDVPDDEGCELPDLEAARAKARKDALFSLAHTAMDEAKINFSHRIDIEDNHGGILDTVWFRDVVRVEG